MKRGEIVWFEPPGDKRRPAVVISPDFLNDIRDRTLVAPCTSQRLDRVTHTEVILDPEGLPKPSKVQCQDMMTVMKSELGAALRLLSANELRALDRAVQISTGLF